MPLRRHRVGKGAGHIAPNKLTERTPLPTLPRRSLAAFAAIIAVAWFTQIAAAQSAPATAEREPGFRAL